MAFFNFIGRWIVYFIVPSFVYSVFLANIFGGALGSGAYIFIAFISFLFAVSNNNSADVNVGPSAYNTKGGYRWKAPRNPGGN